ncbi:MAG: membrane protein insertase YidC [Deltaproteobacteria bacterium]|nr:membrane protein insertase YidC [Deltaproteobacteria bacterium]
MSEQQRIFVAVALCLGILLAWQFFFSPEPTRPPAPPPPATSAAPAAPAADAPEPPAAALSGAPAPKMSPAALPEVRRSFATELLSGELSSRDGALTRLELLHYNERPAEGDKQAPRHPVSLVTAVRDGQPYQAPIDLKLGGRPTPAWIFDETQGPLVLRGQSDGVETRTEIAVRADAYALDYAVSVTNTSGTELPVSAAITLALRRVASQGSFFAPPADLMHGLCATGTEIERRQESGLADDGAWQGSGPLGWAGIDRQYFVAALVPREVTPATCKMNVKDGMLSVSVLWDEERVAPGGRFEKEFTLFLGPKREESLAAASARLTDVIDYSIWGIPLGFLCRPMVFLLNTFHGWIASWGVAIMLLTLLVKALLFPITYKSIISMRKMQLLKPEMDRIKQQFEGDRERQQMEQLKLFKEKGVNPLGGCLPMLMQMPVWFALYRTLWTAVDLYQQPFLWVSDLTAKEPFPFMALVLGALTYVQQKLTPQAADNQQAKMMLYLMPVMLTVFMIALPSGLVLYILVNSILTIIQQLAINRTLPAVQGRTAASVPARTARVNRSGG